MKSAFKFITIIYYSLFIIHCSFTQNPSVKKLNIAINELTHDKALKHASIGIFIKNISSGNLIYELNSEQSLVPASVMKIPTTVAALSILEKNYRFKTTLGYSGTIDDKGVLSGDLYISGGGDPTFGTTRFGNEYSIDSIYNKFYRAILKNGIKQIKGSVVVDGSIFEDEIIPHSWQWDDMGNYYGAGACGLNINENEYFMVLNPGKQEGDYVIVKSIKPSMPYLDMINKATTGKAGTDDNVIIYGSPYSILRIIEGNIPVDKEEIEVKGSFPDPAYYCAYSFHNFLVNKNIIPYERPTTVRNVRAKKPFDIPPINIISAHLSPALDKIIYQTNIKSINTYAEALLKTIGYVKLNEGSTSGGIKTVKDFWKAKDIDIEGLVMNDGSGLSPDDRITAKLLADMLEYALTDNKIKESFYNSLSIAGVSGSIKDNFIGSAAYNNLRAKSGYRNSVRSYAGTVMNKKNEQIIFSIIVNNYNETLKELKAKLEKILISIAELE